MEEHIYAKEVSYLEEAIIKAANKYADYAKTANFKSLEDINFFRNGWLLIVDDFRGVQTKLNEIKIPASLTKEGEELKIAYQRYVDLVEEKTMKYSIESMNSGELDFIQRQEIEQSNKIKIITEKIVSKMVS